MSKSFKYNDFFLSEKRGYLELWVSKNPLGQLMFPLDQSAADQALSDYFQKMGQYAWVNTKNCLDSVRQAGKRLPSRDEVRIMIENYENEWASRYGILMLGTESIVHTEYRAAKMISEYPA